MNEDGHVSISRRGFIAAGLAVAAVGAMGVVSTMNAGADETPTAATAEAAPAVEADPVGEPPSLLPWGARPHPLKVGLTGASSHALAADGESAASDPQAASGATIDFGPKGQSLRNGVMKTSETSVAPLPPGARAAKTQQEVDYLYATGKQAAQTDGVAALLTVANPRVATDDWHSLAEIALQSADEQQIVEVGWNVDRTTNGDNDTHLFVYHWVDGAPTCYNTCDFTPYGLASIRPGDTLATGAVKQFGIQHFNGAWWVAYDTEWIGYFADSVWDNSFTRTGLVQFFGEVAASSTTPCTQMGNGTTPDNNTAAAKIGSAVYLNGPTVQLHVTSTNAYPTTQVTDRTFRYGGPGSC
jgi:hypothetical protein